jgi:hypothetical protein
MLPGCWTLRLGIALVAAITFSEQAHAQQPPAVRPPPRGLTQLPARLGADPASLTFSYEIGSRPPADQPVQVSSGDARMTFSAAASEPWLLVNPTRGTTPQQLSVKVNPAGLTEGTYRGTIALTRINEPSVQPRASTSLVGRLAVTLIVSRQPPPPPPRLIPDPSTISFNYEIDSRPPADQTVRVSSDGVPVRFRATTTSDWLSVNPGGTTPQQLSVKVNTAGLGAGSYSDAITLTPIQRGDSTSPPVRVAVTLIVNRRQPPPLPTQILVDPPSLSFSYEIGSAEPAERSVQVRSAGEAVGFGMTRPGSWLSITPATGTTPQQLSVKVNTAGLAEGPYTETITLTPIRQPRELAAQPAQLTVTLVVTRGQPPPPRRQLQVDPPSLSFSSEIGATALAERLVQVRSEGEAVSFTVAKASNWLSISPATGTTPQQLSVRVNTIGLAEGAYSDTITLRSAGAPNVAQVIVTVVITGRPLDLWWLLGLVAVLGLLGVVVYQRRQMRNMVHSSVRAVAEADPPVLTIDSGGEDFVESEIRIEITSDPGEQHLKSDDALVREVTEE